MKLAIIDLDGVVADNTKRMEIAETTREFYRQHLGDAMPEALANPVNHASVQKGFDDLLESLYWQAAFQPRLTKYDTLIEGAREAMNTLMNEGILIVYLTSRPESMRVATLTWLGDHDILHYANGGNIDDIEVIMKAPAFQFTKTPVWKAGMVQTLATLYGVDEVLFVDDDEANCDALRQACSTEDTVMMYWYHSLAEAVEAIASKGA